MKAMSFAVVHYAMIGSMHQIRSKLKVCAQCLNQHGYFRFRRESLYKASCGYLSRKYDNLIFYENIC